MRRPAGLAALAALAAIPLAAQAPAPTRSYDVLVAAEAVDRIYTVRFGPEGARVVQEVSVGMMPTEPDGPHGLGVAPDGKTYYVSTAHGAPSGYLWKLDAATGRTLGKVALGNFPATLQVTPNGYLAFVVNFNLHGEMVPSSMSVVATDELVEVARITTCTMPHGSRLNPAGTRHYSGCMMDDALVEIDAERLEVSRWFRLTKGAEAGFAGAPEAALRAAGGHAGHDMAGHGMETPKPGDVSCSPTWAQPSADGTKVYVACNKSSEIVEVDVASWTMTRRWATGEGTYNLAATRDGRLLVGTNKRGQSVSVMELATGRELARLPTRRRVPSGVAISPDDRYAFVTVEGVGSEPGTLEVIDLVALRTVATVDVGQMAGGVDVLPAR